MSNRVMLPLRNPGGYHDKDILHANDMPALERRGREISIKGDIPPCR